MKTIKSSSGLGQRWEAVQRRLAAAVNRANRSAAEVTLIAISKTHPAQSIAELIDLGALHVGENRVQEAEPKILEIGRERVTWHLVGHLQANKARRAVKFFDVVHSLDSIDLAKRLNRLCEEEGRSELKVLVQVDLGGEETKSGVDESELPSIIETCQSLDRVRLSGLMTLPPFFEEQERARPYFQKLRDLRDHWSAAGAFGSERGELSMGMTNDFEVAIEEGATMVRVGTAIFGERLPLK
jgi:PLP dependent protein